MAINTFSDPIFIDWHKDGNGNKISIQRTALNHKVVLGRAVLDYIPDEFYKVSITSPANMTEIKLSDTITTSTQYKCDYTYGILYLHSSLEASTITVSYRSRGIIMYSVDRIYKSLSEDGLTVTETLQDYMDTVDSYENKGIYNSGTTYSHNNIVLYNNSSFISTSLTDITNIIPTNTAYWKCLTQGIYDKGTYDNSTQYYVGDMVWYDSTKSKYIVHTKPSVGVIPTNASYWTKVMDFSSIYTEVSHMVHRGVYNPSTEYVKHNQVEYQGSSYVVTSETPVTGVLPTVQASWNLVSSRGSNLSFKGAYNSGTSYVINDVVSYENQSYVCILNSTNHVPTNITYWSLFSMNNVSALRSIVVLGNETNTFNINISSYDSSVDLLEIYQNNTHLHPTIDYTINQYTQGRIDKPSGNWNAGTSFSIIVYKNFNNLITFNSGTVLQDESVSISKLDQSTQDAITANVNRVKSYNGNVTIPFASATNTVNVGAYINQYDHSTDTLDVYLNSTFLSPSLYTKSGNNIILNSGNFGGLTENDSDFLDFVVKKSMTDVPLETFSGSLITNGTINNSAFSSVPLQNLAVLNSTTGLLTQTGTNTFSKRTLTSGNTKITVTNGNGVSGNPTLTANEDNFNFANGLTQSQISTPTTPSASYTKLYPKSDGKVYKLNSSGYESCIEYGISTKEIGLTGDGTTNDATKLNTWITSIGSTKVDLIVTSGTYLISTNVTFPKNVNVVFMHGGIFKVSNGFSITGTNTKLECGLWQCFDLSLGGTVGGNWDVKEVYPEWFGAIADNSTDCTLAFNKAMRFKSSLNLVLATSGTYLLGSPVSKTSGKISFTAKEGAIVKIKSGFGTGTALFTFSNMTDVHINKLTIDGSRDLLGYPDWNNYIYAISVITCSNSVKIENCYVHNHPSIGVSVMYSNFVRIENNFIEDGMYHPIFVKESNISHINKNKCVGIGNQGTNGNLGGLGILVTEGNYAFIKNNYIYDISDTATKTEGTNHVVYDGNYVENCGKDGIKVMRYLTADPAYFPSYAKIVNNTVKYIHYWRNDGNALIQLQEIEKVVISNNIVTGGQKTEGDERGIVVKGDTGGLYRPKNVIVSNNVITDPISEGIYVDYVDKDVIIEGNISNKNIYVTNPTGNTNIINNTVEYDSLSSSNSSIYVDNFENLYIKSNRLKNGSNFLQIQPRGNSKICDVMNNSMSYCYSSAIRIKNFTTTPSTMPSINMFNNLINEVNVGNIADRGAIDISINYLTVSSLSIVGNKFLSTNAPSNGYIHFRDTGTAISNYLQSDNFNATTEVTKFDSTRISNYLHAYNSFNNTSTINLKYPPVPMVGAKGDGITDDTLAIQNIINSLSGIKKLNLSDGIYKCTSNINLISNMTLTSDNNGKLVFSGESCLVLDGVNNVKIKGVDVVGAESYGILISDCTNIDVYECKVHDTWSTGIRVVRTTQDDAIKDNVNIIKTEIYNTGVKTNLDSWSYGHGIKTIRVNNVNILNCDIHHTYGHAAIYTQLSKFINIHDNHIYNTAYRGIEAKPADDYKTSGIVTLEGISIKRNKVHHCGEINGTINRITNPTLAIDSNSNNVADNWTYASNGVTTATTSIDGGQKLTITNASSNSQSITISQVVEIFEPLGQDIIFEVKYKTSGNINARFAITAGVTTLLAAVSKKSDGVYTTETNTVTVPPSTGYITINLAARVDNVSDTGSVWFKDISLKSAGTGKGCNGMYLIGALFNPAYINVEENHVYKVGENCIEGGGIWKNNVCEESGYYDNLPTTSQEGIYPNANTHVIGNTVINAKLNPILFLEPSNDNLVVRGNTIINSRSANMSGIRGSASSAGKNLANIEISNNTIISTNGNLIYDITLNISNGGTADYKTIKVANNTKIGITNPSSFDIGGSPIVSTEIATKAGIISDTDFATTPNDASFGIDTTNNRLYVRVNGVWKYASLT